MAALAEQSAVIALPEQTEGENKEQDEENWPTR